MVKVFTSDLEYPLVNQHFASEKLNYPDFMVTITMIIYCFTCIYIDILTVYIHIYIYTYVVLV